MRRARASAGMAGRGRLVMCLNVRRIRSVKSAADAASACSQHSLLSSRCASWLHKRRSMIWARMAAGMTSESKAAATITADLSRTRQAAGGAACLRATRRTSTLWTSTTFRRTSTSVQRRAKSSTSQTPRASACAMTADSQAPTATRPSVRSAKATRRSAAVAVWQKRCGRGTC